MKKVYLVALVLLVFRSYSQTHIVTNLSNSGTGSLVGLGVETLQAQKGKSSGFDPQDFYSNSLGYRFYRHEHGRNSWIAEIVGLKPANEYAKRVVRFLISSGLRNYNMTGY